MNLTQHSGFVMSLLKGAERFMKNRRARDTSLGATLWDPGNLLRKPVPPPKDRKVTKKRQELYETSAPALTTLKRYSGFSDTLKLKKIQTKMPVYKSDQSKVWFM